MALTQEKKTVGVRVATSAGFCFGVERIVALAEQLVAENPDRAYSLGDLIHNPREVRRLRDQGLQIVQRPEDLPELLPGQTGTVLIRAHGVAPQVKEAIKAKGYELVDGTCPLVTIPQRFARQIVREGYRLVIMGHIAHPEIQGILGHVKDLPGRVDVITGPHEVPKLNLKASDRVGLISQTTHPYEHFAQLVGEVLKHAIEVKAYNTICQATFDRQDAVRELAQQSDLVIVIGGHNSSNTNRLAEIAAEYTTCYHIENAAELQEEWLVDRSRIGITAGASTPNAAIEQVKQRIEELIARAGHGR